MAGNGSSRLAAPLSRSAWALTGAGVGGVRGSSAGGSCGRARVFAALESVAAQAAALGRRGAHGLPPKAFAAINRRHPQPSVVVA